MFFKYNQLPTFPSQANQNCQTVLLHTLSFKNSEADEGEPANKKQKLSNLFGASFDDCRELSIVPGKCIPLNTMYRNPQQNI